MTLGTVEFGLDYGITNINGKVGYETVKEILNFAKKSGINTLDTARNYGDSEAVLGRIGVDSYKIVTKLPVVDNSSSRMINIFFNSLERLKQKNIYGLLIHNIDGINNKNFDTIFKEISDLKNQGLVEKIGFSTYDPKHVDFLLKNFDFDLIQVPFNIFDQRLLYGGQLSKLKRNGVEIHARSVFLQGLLLMSLKNIPLWFDPIRNKLENFHLEAKKNNLSTLELALGFAHSINEIDKIIVGVDTLEHLEEIVTSSSASINTTEFSNLLINDPIFVNPSNWKK